MKKSLIIYNGIKTNNYFVKNLDSLIKYLSRNDYEITIKATIDENDLYDTLIKIKDIDLLCCAGGDGTMHQVVNGISKLINKPNVLYFPNGTVNDFAYSLNLKHNIYSNLRLLENNELKTIDSAIINDKYFNYVCAFGAFSSASYKVSNDTKDIFGAISYAVSSIPDLVKLNKGHKMKLVIDETEIIEDEFVLGVISNSNSVAGMRSLFKENKFDDGLFEIFFVSKTNVINLGALGNLIYNGGLTDNINDKNCIYRKVKKLKVYCEENVIWTLDGEKGPKGNINIEVVNHNYKIYAPKENK